MLKMELREIAPAAIADRLMARAGRSGLRSPGLDLLAPIRRAAAQDVLDRVRDDARVLALAATRRESGAREAFERLAAAALEDMRRTVDDRARQRGPVHDGLARLDSWWRNTAQTEHIDDAALDPALRTNAMRTLDRVNDLIGSYDEFIALLRRAAAAVDRPLRVIDLAAGHGGFALAVARAARQDGLPIEVTATDLKPEYLALAERTARADRLPVAFATQNALDLSNLAPGAFDVVTCTQALHHFSPGAVATMIGEAARVAGQTVLFIDGARTFMHAPPVYAYLWGRARDPILAHDGWVSCRRFFAPEELALLAGLGPWGGRGEWMAPNHCVVTVPAWRVS